MPVQLRADDGHLRTVLECNFWQRQVHANHLDRLGRGWEVWVTLYLSYEGPIPVGLDACDHRQVLAGDVRQQTVDPGLPGGETALAVLAGNGFAETGDLCQLRDFDHLGEEIPFAKLVTRPSHVVDGRETFPLR